ncbi:MAG: hypothetical protein M5T61_10075 [Acidimicrobiia bacterium]|nr:hypothetical protein [Acidimicrobiia bacterium]
MSLLHPDILGNGLSQQVDQPQGVRPRRLDRRAGAALLAAYPAFIALVLAAA